MNVATGISHNLPLLGLDGSNPLGFLTALGVLQTLTHAHPEMEPRLSWEIAAGRWRPFLYSKRRLGRSQLAEELGKVLRIGFKPEAKAARHHKQTEKAFDTAKRKLREIMEDVKSRRLARADRTASIERETSKARDELAACHAAWLAALHTVIPAPELALGRDLGCTADEFRVIAKAMCRDSDWRRRRETDLLAAFGSDGCFDARTQRIESTRFCFITGSGHQYFLETVRQLFEAVTVEKLERAVFENWVPEDQKLSMRWDPLDDRRHALMAADPTSAGNETKTVWAANLLAYEGIALLRAAPTADGLRVTGWSRQGSRDFFTWPIWRPPVSVSVIRSLLSHAELHKLQSAGAASDESALARQILTRIGVVEIYRSERIEVGKPPLNKVNFTPAQTV